MRRLSLTHIVPSSPMQDIAGPIARDVTTAARVLSAMAGTGSTEPATVKPDSHRGDCAATLDRRALMTSELAFYGSRRVVLPQRTACSTRRSAC
jgi:amidase